MKKSLRRILLGLYATRLGQFVVRKCRKSPSGIWNRTRELRIWLFRDNNPPRNQESPGSPNRREHFEAILEILSKPIKMEKMASSSHPLQKIQIFSPDTPGNLHTISSLARYQNSLIKDIVPTRSFLATKSIDKKKIGLFDEFILSSKSNSFDGEINIYHLGNNYNSAMLLQHILSSNSPRIIIELHDLWIYDLLNDFGTLHGFENFGEELVRDALGAFGVVVLHCITRGKKDCYTEQQKMEVASILLNVLSKIDAIYITHGVNVEFEDYLRKFGSIRIIKLELPVHYIGAKNAQSLVGPSRKMIVSGSASYSKETKTTALLLIELASIIDELRIDVVGSICIAMERELSVLLLSRDTLRKFRLHPNVSEEKWNELHVAADCGIRLGVGNHGEASGVVRDYLFFGMKVISDELSPSLFDNPNYFYFNKEVDFSENVHHLKQFLNAEIEIKSENSDSSTSLYKSKLLEILGV